MAKEEFRTAKHESRRGKDLFRNPRTWRLAIAPCVRLDEVPQAYCGQMKAQRATSRRLLLQER